MDRTTLHQYHGIHHCLNVIAEADEAELQAWEAAAVYLVGNVKTKVAQAIKDRRRDLAGGS